MSKNQTNQSNNEQKSQLLGLDIEEFTQALISNLTVFQAGEGKEKEEALENVRILKENYPEKFQDFFRNADLEEVGREMIKNGINFYTNKGEKNYLAIFFPGNEKIHALLDNEKAFAMAQEAQSRGNEDSLKKALDDHIFDFSKQDVRERVEGLKNIDFQMEALEKYIKSSLFQALDQSKKEEINRYKPLEQRIEHAAKTGNLVSLQEIKTNNPQNFSQALEKVKDFDKILKKGIKDLFESGKIDEIKGKIGQEMLEKFKLGTDEKLQKFASGPKNIFEQLADIISKIFRSENHKYEKKQQMAVENFQPKATPQKQSVQRKNER